MLFVYSWLIIVRSVRLGYGVHARVNSVVWWFKVIGAIAVKVTVAFRQINQINNIIYYIIYFQICKLVWGNQYMYKLFNTFVFI